MYNISMYQYIIICRKTYRNTEEITYLPYKSRNGLRRYRSTLIPYGISTVSTILIQPKSN